MKILLTLALLLPLVPGTPAKGGSSQAILFLAVPNEAPPGNVAEVADLYVDPTDGLVYMTFSSAPHGVQTGCWYSEHDFFGYGSGGDWGAYETDYVVYSPLLRSWIRQTLTAAGWSQPSCR